MNTYRSHSRRERFVILALTLVIALGLLEALASGMKFRDATMVAAHAEFLAAEAARAQQLRALEGGDVQFAVAVPDGPL